MASPAAGLQAALNQLGLKLVVDGVVGMETRKAWQMISAFERDFIDDSLIEEYGMRSRDVIGERGYAVPDYVYLSKSVCDKMVERACKLLRMSEYSEVFKEFLRLEAARVTIGGETHYNVLSRNGRHRGLMQFYDGAWEDARRTAKRVNAKLDIGNYRENVYFPANSIIAGIAYALQNIDIMAGYGIEVSGETLYVSHNQGPHIWKYPEKLKRANQSAEVQEVIERYFPS